MSGYMLDSNVLIDIVRNVDGMVAKHFRTKALGEIAISVIVSGEVRYGMRKRPEARSNPSMAYLLTSLRIDQVEPDVDNIYGNLRLDTERQGKGMSPNDYWIVAHALAKGAVLVSSDAAIHEAKVAGLQVEDWRGELAVHGQD